MSIRPATESDLDAIVYIALAAQRSDDLFQYRYPYSARYPDETLKSTQWHFEQLMKAGKSIIMVYECPSNEDHAITKPVAFSVWQPPSTRFSNSPIRQLAKAFGRDASPARIKAFSAAVGKARPKILDEKYGEAQFYLLMLACHPDYQRRGAGTMLCEWGIGRAKADNLNVTLAASPMGKPLYTKFGFKLAGTFRTQIEGEDEYLDRSYMVLEFP